MTAIDLIRSARATRAAGGDPDAPERPPLTPRTAALRGAVAAAASALVVVGVVVLGWGASSRSTVGLLPTLGLGIDGWLLAHGGRIAAGQAHVALTPLLLWAGIVSLVVYAVRPVLSSEGRAAEDEPRWAIRIRPVAAFTGGYAVITALLGLLTLAAPARPDPISAAAVLGTVIVGIVVAAWRSSPDGAGVRGLLPDRVSVPGTVRRAVAPALWGIGGLLVAGAVVVLGAVVIAFGDVRHVQGELGAGVVGGTLLAVGQLLYLPNLALWVISFAAGSGFQIVAGAPTTWSGSRAGLMPMIPVFAALPSPGGFSVVMAVVILIPLGAGVLVGVRSLRTVSRLSSLRTKAAVAATAAVLTALTLGALDGLAGGSLGAYRLADLGAPALMMTGLLALELLVGALGTVLWDVWRLHRH
ncbi:conserved membrane hypothetical protein [Nostocoides japonicum T1-X7]|uniref:Uncharacterized protein n=1 Tax=Nostocoides japonicum T1-X7 TaxID=1194083 RepID=A0A077M1E8_9MICO|nr:DUF6350 family protein [Tetrasphaera japonica]CCH78025.1 conserved membrane hypothetical protein [Tetrasphaera japonica T1-X7]